MNNGCQSPIHRDTHFYKAEINGEVKRIYVSIPYTSGHPFLHREAEENYLQYPLCQSPIHRDTHFYEEFEELLKSK